MRSVGSEVDIKRRAVNITKGFSLHLTGFGRSLGNTAEHRSSPRSGEADRKPSSSICSSCCSAGALGSLSLYSSILRNSNLNSFFLLVPSKLDQLNKSHVFMKRFNGLKLFFSPLLSICFSAVSIFLNERCVEFLLDGFLLALNVCVVYGIALKLIATLLMTSLSIPPPTV